MSLTPFTSSPLTRLSLIAALAAASLYSPPLHALQADFAVAVTATHPIAYFPLETPAGKSLAGSSISKPVGGVTVDAPGAPIGAPGNHFTRLNGKDAYILTTQVGGVGEAASILIWVNLDDLPSKAGRFFYVAGESQNGNDLDIQFETDNALRFYTAAGGHLTYIPAPATLVGQWHMIVATLDTQTHTRVIYWDGKQVATDKGGGESGKTSPFSIGASTVFSGRFFKGGVQAAGLWNRALKTSEVAGIYAAAHPGPASGARASAGAAGSPSATGPFATTAKVEFEDAGGPVKIKREEQIAFMFLSAIEIIERECQLDAQHACSLDQALSGSAGPHIEHLKFNPASDPNYSYTLAAAGMAWEAHANPKKPGLAGFCYMSRGIGTTVTTYNPAGPAGWVDKEILSRGIDGDSFATQ